MIKLIRLQFSIAAVFCCSACTTPPEKAIVKHWKIATVKGRHSGSQENARRVEIEFTKDGKLLMFEKGILHTSMPYILAPDGKSLLISDPSGRENASAQIISLSSAELVISSRIFDNDTLTLIAN